MTERVVITGMGTINPLGHSVTETWANVLKGMSGVGPITRFDAATMPVQIACEVKGYDPAHFMPARDARRQDHFEQFAMIAARQALAESGLEISEVNAARIGVLVATAVGGITSLEDAILTIFREGPRRVSPFTIPMLMANGAAGMIAIEVGARGPSSSVGTACASGADAIGLGWLMIRAGMIDSAITGAGEAPISSIGVSAFDRVGALSRQGGARPATPRPFDAGRDGFVMGEGAAVLVLESESFARDRGANILAELAGYGTTADAYHITAPPEDGIGGAAAMAQALDSARIPLESVNYINAHGTATILNDRAETRAIKSVFGELAYNIPVSSTKSMTGHMIGATGALEAIFCVKAIQDGVIPPTIHYQTPDPDCDLDYVPNQARQHPVKVAISNAFGFGGHNAVLVMQAYS